MEANTGYAELNKHLCSLNLPLRRSLLPGSGPLRLHATNTHASRLVASAPHGVPQSSCPDCDSIAPTRELSARNVDQCVS